MQKRSLDIYTIRLILKPTLICCSLYTARKKLDACRLEQRRLVVFQKSPHDFQLARHLVYEHCCGDFI